MDQELKKVMAHLNLSREVIQELRTREQSEPQRRLAILATEIEKVSAFAEYVHNSVPTES